MRIIINALFLRAKIAGGTETYVTNIVKPWYIVEAQGFTFLLLTNHIPEWWAGDRAWFQLMVVENSNKLLFRNFFEQFIMPFLAPDWNVLFNPGYVGIIGARCPQVITVHDAYAWVMPQEIGIWRALFWRKMIRWTAQRSAAVIAVSASTRNDLLNFIKVDKEKIHVIYEAGDHVQVSNHTFNSEHKRENQNYFIGLGIFKEIKNPTRILEAYTQYRITMIERGLVPYRFKLVGAIIGAKGEKMLQWASKIEGVEILGRVEDPELYEIIKDSKGLIFASLYEGFGLPILEAQRLGCPVLTSQISSMPEVAGAGALLVDPLDAKSIHYGMLKLCSPECRVELVQRGFDNVRRFSWRVASEATLKLLASVARTENQATTRSSARK